MTDASRFFVFVALTGDEEIRTYSMDAGSGALELAGVSPAHGPIGALTPGPSGDRVYGAHVGSTELSSYRLDRTSGALEHINKVATGHATPALAVACGGGRFLIAGYYTGGGVTVHAVADDGSIGDLVQRVDTGEKAHAVLIDPTERFVFIPHVCPVNKTSQFRFESSSGQLTANDPAEVIPPDDYTGPRHMCFGPGGDVVYTVNEQGNSVTAQRYDADRGTLEIFQTVLQRAQFFNLLTELNKLRPVDIRRLEIPQQFLVRLFTRLALVLPACPDIRERAIGLGQGSGKLLANGVETRAQSRKNILYPSQNPRVWQLMKGSTGHKRRIDRETLSQFTVQRPKWL